MLAFDRTPDHRSPKAKKTIPIPAEKTVLLIDDEEMIRDITSEMLQYLGYRCLTAADGSQGIDLYRANQKEIDLVILDVEMPGLPGDKVFTKLKEIEPGTQVIICSGYSREYLENRVFRRKLDHFIAKPFQIQTLLAQLKRLLETADV